MKIDNKKQTDLKQVQSFFQKIGVQSDFSSEVGANGDHWPKRFKIAKTDQNAIIAYPETSEEVAKIIEYANKNKLQVSALGLASSVVGCFDGGADIYCSTERLNQVEEFDSTNSYVSVGAGMNGGDLQQYLIKRGFELGQTPQSLYMSTVGGWVNTRAIGGLSTYYGGIEDVVVGLEAVLGTGEIVKVSPSPRPQGGLDLVQNIIGTEGSLAIVTKVTLSIFRQLPTAQLAAGFETFDQAIEVQRQLVQGGFPVALLRSYNIEETSHIVPSDEPFALLNFTLVAPAEALDGLKTAAEKLVINNEGWSLDEDAASLWYRHRYECETMMEDRNVIKGEMFDTVELSLPWSTAAACSAELEEKIGAKTTRFFAHFSHAYQTGACLYAIFWVKDKNDDSVVTLWTDIWDEIIAIVASHSGTLSHHHGIGAVRSARYLKTDQALVHQKIKAVLDPNNVLKGRLLEG
ncbi:MAG: FAD-binding oxidoreductase [Alphaproteobacteria bacterium]